MRLKTIFFSLMLVTYLPVSAQLWHSVGEKVDDAVAYLYTDSLTDRLYGGGSFSWFGSLYAPKVAAWNGINWEKLDGSVNDVADAFCNYHDTLFVGGGFQFAGGMYSPYLAQWKNGQWFPYGTANASVTCFAIWNGDLYVAGDFDSIGGIRANGLARYNGSTWSTVGDLFGFSIPNNNLIGKVVVLNNILYIAGALSDSANGSPEFASWDGIKWTNYYNLFNGPWSGGFPWVEYKGQIYVIGLSSKADGDVVNCVATFDGTSLHDVGGGITSQFPYAQVTDAYVFHNKLYVVGIFDSAGGVPAQNIACWNGEKWCGLGSKIDNKILAITSYHDTLYIGGGFWTIDGDSINYIAKWLGGDFVDTCSAAVGISEINQNNFDFSIYPNPATSELEIVLPKNYQSQQLKIINPLGQIMKQQEFFSNRISTDISDLASGVYFLELQTEKGATINKFVKQ